MDDVSRSTNSEAPSAPKDWTAAVEAARLLYIGKTQREAADAADVTPRTLRRWRKADWWSEAQSDARDAYFDSLTGKARAKILEAVEDDHWLAMKVLERAESTSHERGGSSGGAVLVVPDNGRGLDGATFNVKPPGVGRASGGDMRERVRNMSDDELDQLRSILTDEGEAGGAVLVVPDNGRGLDGDDGQGDV